MTNIKPGDQVRYIDTRGTNEYTPGCVYTVTEVYEAFSNHPEPGEDYLIRTNASDFGLYVKRFELVKEEKKMTKFEVGDTIRCIDNGGAPNDFIVGGIYTVRHVDDDVFIYVNEVTDTGMYNHRFELFHRESKKFETTLIGGKPYSECNKLPERKILVMKDDGDTIIVRSNNPYIKNDWAYVEIVKIVPKMDENGWWKLSEVHPNKGDVVQLCIRDKKYQSGHSLRTIIWEKYYNNPDNFTHWKLFKGPVND